MSSEDVEEERRGGEEASAGRIAGGKEGKALEGVVVAARLNRPQIAAKKVKVGRVTFFRARRLPRDFCFHLITFVHPAAAAS